MTLQERHRKERTADERQSKYARKSDKLHNSEMKRMAQIRKRFVRALEQCAAAPAFSDKPEPRNVPELFDYFGVKNDFTDFSYKTEHGTAPAKWKSKWGEVSGMRWGELPERLKVERQEIHAQRLTPSEREERYSGAALYYRGRIETNAPCVAMETARINQHSGFVIENEDGTFYAGFTSNRPTARATMKQKDKYFVRAQAFDKVDGDALLLLCTYKQKQFNGDRIKAWQKVRDDWPIAIRALRAAGITHYIRVVEAHASGFPHVHIYCKAASKKINDIKEYIDHHAEVFGDVHFDTANVWPHGLTNAKKVDGNAAAFYIAKYLSKANCCETLFADCDGMGLNEKATKAMHGDLLSYFTGVRLYASSKNLAVEARSIPLSCMVLRQMQIDGIVDFSAQVLNAPQNLLGLMYKSTNQCSVRSYFISHKRVTQLNVELKQGIFKSDDFTVREIVESGLRISCAGCLWCPEKRLE